MPRPTKRIPGTKFPGGHRSRVTPVPIPNTEVKPATADGTARAGGWESRSLPGINYKARVDYFTRAFSLYAQLPAIEHTRAGNIPCLVTPHQYEYSQHCQVSPRRDHRRSRNRLRIKHRLTYFTIRVQRFDIVNNRANHRRVAPAIYPGRQPVGSVRTGRRQLFSDVL